MDNLQVSGVILLCYVILFRCIIKTVECGNDMLKWKCLSLWSWLSRYLLVFCDISAMNQVKSIRIVTYMLCANYWQVKLAYVSQWNKSVEIQECVHISSFAWISFNYPQWFSVVFTLTSNEFRWILISIVVFGRFHWLQLNGWWENKGRITTQLLW